MESLVKSMRVLSDPTRLRLVRLLREQELTVAELQEILGMGQSRISANLGQLKREGLVDGRRVGKNIYYSSALDRSSPLVGVIEGAGSEIRECRHDDAALALALKKRKDTASEYFNLLAGKFGRTYVPGRSWQALAHALLRLLPPMVIADLGAGEGTLSQLLARSAEKVIGVDRSEKMVEFASGLARRHGFKNIEFRVGDMESPPVGDGEVDLALFSQALHHAVRPAVAVREAFRILRPGGRIVILDLLSHSHEQTKELYAHEWLGFPEVGLHEMLTKSGFREVDVSIVAREKQAPHFQTVLALGRKPKKNGR